MRYNDSLLENEDFDIVNNNVIVAASDLQINIKSLLEEINSVIVYDVLGRKIFEKSKVNNTLFTISDIVPNHQTLIVKISLVNGQIITRKIIL